MIKIEKALIFAAGKGSRIRPLSKTTPKPLIEVNGKPMIETIIEALLENDIKDIYITLGYKKEKFYYLKDKYNEVSFIINEEFESRNTISSFYAAKDILDDNFIISEGDLRIQDSNIFNPYIEKTTYLYRPGQNQNEEWGFILDENKIVKEIVNPTESDYLTNNLYGVSFWTKEDIMLLRNEVEKEYYNEKYINSAYDELVNNIIDDLSITVREVTKEQIVEVDSLKDLVEIDKSYLDILNREEQNKFQHIIDLSKTLSLNGNELVAVYQSPGRSLSNKNFVIEISDEKYFLRIAGEGTELFSDREIEQKAYSLLQETGIVDEVFFLDPKTGMKISKFYENSRILNVNNEKDIEKYLDKLRLLHATGFDFIKTDSIFDRMVKYDEFVKEANGLKYYDKDIDKIIKILMTHENKLLQQMSCVSIHGDSSPNNTLVLENGDLILIDLEFVTMGDPYTDLATFAHDAEMTTEECLELLYLYLERKPNREEKYKFFIFAAVVSIMWYSWAVYKMIVEPSNFYKFKSYRDAYYKWYEIMYEEAVKYEL